MSKQFQANLMLIIAALIWGSAFVAQSVGMDYVGPYTFLAVRSLLGGVVLLPFALLRRRSRSAKKPAASFHKKDLWVASALCGVILCISTSFQQFGLLDTTAGKSGFITALYVVLVPVVGLLLGKRVSANTWISVAIAAAALYLLCVNERFTIGPGELLTLGCALGFTFHILVIDHFSARVDGVMFASLQFLICGVLSGICMFLFEKPEISSILRCWLPICYAGILSSGVGYTLQIFGQKNTKPAVASLLMSLESVFAVLSGAVLLHERLSIKEYLGCALMFGAIVLAQWRRNPLRKPQRIPEC